MYFLNFLSHQLFRVQTLSYRTDPLIHGALLGVMSLIMVPVKSLSQLQVFIFYFFVLTFVGGAHCVDMYPYTKGSPNLPEPDAVAATIQIVTENVAYYLTLDSPYGGGQTDGSAAGKSYFWTDTSNCLF